MSELGEYMRAALAATEAFEEWCDDFIGPNGKPPYTSWSIDFSENLFSIKIAGICVYRSSEGPPEELDGDLLARRYVAALHGPNVTINVSG
jgi:hypothetical protein